MKMKGKNMKGYEKMGDYEECPDCNEVLSGFLFLSRRGKNRKKFWLVIKVIQGKKRPYVARKLCATQGL